MVVLQQAHVLLGLVSIASGTFSHVRIIDFSLPVPQLGTLLANFVNPRLLLSLVGNPRVSSMIANQSTLLVPYPAHVPRILNNNWKICCVRDLSGYASL
jgi:hypothetical protein